MKRRECKQTGFALLLVLILVATSMVLGLSYLTSASVKLASSNNLVNAGRAKYLAESGLQHAMYIVQNDSDSILASPAPLGPYFADDTDDSYVFYATADADVRGKYLLTAEATAGGARQSSSVTILFFETPQLSVSHAMFVGGGAVLSSKLRISGDLHTNGNLLNFARIDGDVSASRSIRDPRRRISGQKTPDAPVEEVPDIQWSNYTDYSIGGVACNAAQTDVRKLQSDDPLADGGAVTADNPGGVVWLTPSRGHEVKLDKNLQFTGTLVIDGDLVLDGKNVDLTAVEGFPAIVVSGKIYVTKKGKNVTINGLVVAAGGIVRKGRGTRRSRTTINGGLVSNNVGYDRRLDGNHALNYDAERCTIYDFSADSQEASALEILQWND